MTTSMKDIFERFWAHTTNKIEDALKNVEVPQSDWHQNDETAKDYIKNKPTIPNDEEMLELLMETEIASPVSDEAGAVYIDNNEKIYIL